jgi:hypothetical protein
VSHRRRRCGSDGIERASVERQIPPASILLRHQRKLARREPEPFDPTFDWDEFIATQPRTTEEWMAAMGVGQ